MKITVKNYKSCRGNEGDAFSCTMYLDGKKAALVEYAGTGGEYEFDFSISDKKMLGGAMSQKYDEYVREHQMKAEDYKPGDENGEYFLYCGRDIVLEEFITAMLEERQLKRWCKTNVVYRFKGDEPGSYFQWKLKWTPQLAPVIRGKLETLGARKGKALEVIVNERFAA